MRLLAFALLVAPLVASAQDGNARAIELARTSKSAAKSVEFIRGELTKLPAGPVKAAALALYDDAKLTFMARLATTDAQEKMRKELVDAGLLDAKTTLEQLFPPLPPLPFLAAPGGTTNGHHDYPGGLAEHTAFNVQAALALADDYRARYGIELDRTTVVAAPALHDLMKTWVLQWHADGTQLVQATVAGTSSHHPFIVAEALYRRLPTDFVVALASAHEPAQGASYDKLVGFLRAGAILAGVDPVAAGVLAKDGDKWKLAKPPAIEAGVNHLSDHDYVITDPAGALINACLQRILAAESPSLDESGLRWRRYQVEAQVPGMRIYALWRAGGDDAVRAELVKRHVLAKP